MKNRNWYVAFTCPNHEKKVRDRFNKLGIETFLPLRKVERQWSDRIKVIEQPLFSCYLFVKALESDLYELTQINGVVRFLAFQNQFAVMKEKEIVMINQIVKHNPEFDVHPYAVHRGLKVQVKHGLFKGFEGLIKQQENKDRLIIEFPHLRQNISLSIPMSYLAYT